MLRVQDQETTEEDTGNNMRFFTSKGRLSTDKTKEDHREQKHDKIEIY